MAHTLSHAITPENPSSLLEDSSPSTTRATPSFTHDTLPPPDDLERHDTIPAPTWLDDPGEAVEGFPIPRG